MWKAISVSSRTTETRLARGEFLMLKLRLHSRFPFVGSLSMTQKGEHCLIGVSELHCLGKPTKTKTHFLGAAFYYSGCSAMVEVVSRMCFVGSSQN